ncbi:uncharacterized protein LOC131361120 [Hemibagrus wyckioides]|uniref:uncharacterized protein LOC131361120 n=1 Tax=Hemibagrus wyckioides TaxID=337641 RepID=UPI00266BDF95|nr:uncharacterized protein LOC131361120 [Hemibagrus wyckioides]
MVKQEEETSLSVPAQTLGRRSSGHKCLICGILFADLGQHLRVTESVAKRTELTLLCKLSHRQFSARLDCPVSLCKSKRLSRLDKHLQKIHHLDKPTATMYVNKAKDRYISMELLRASHPIPPMVSHIDEVDECAIAIEEGVRREIEASTPSPASHQSTRRYACEEGATPSTQGEHAVDEPPPVSEDQTETPEKTSASCSNCQQLQAELRITKQLLQMEADRNDELKQLHSAVKYIRREPFSPSKAPKYVRLLEEFRCHIQRVNASRKGKENAKQQQTHVLHFSEFMADSPFQMLTCCSWTTTHESVSLLKAWISDISRHRRRGPT